VKYQDEHHGTKTSGSAAAKGNNNIGVTGMCWNCKIMPLTYATGNSNQLSQAIIYATDNGADIISMSIVYSVPVQNIKDALDYAFSNNIVLIASSGNHFNDIPNYPAAYDNVISVAATGLNDEEIGSNYGGWVDVAAPGRDIWTTCDPSSYCQAGGTSISAPLVAGIAGLIKSKNPSYTNKEIMSIIQSSTDPIQYDSQYYEFVGTGRINAYKSLLYDKIPIALLNKQLFYYGKNNQIEIKGTATTINPNEFQEYKLEYAKGPYPLPSQWITLATSSTPIDDGVLYTFQPNELEEGSYTFKLTVTDTYGNTAIDMTNIRVYTDRSIINIASNGYSSPLLADINNDGYLETIAASYIDHLLYVFDKDGNIIQGFPVNLESEIIASPTSADIDNDNYQEIIIGTLAGKLYVINNDGTLQQGFPIVLGEGFTMAIETTPAIGDVDNDGNLEIIATSKKSIYIISQNAVIEQKIDLDGSLKASPVLADLNNDNYKEIIIPSHDRLLHTYSYNGLQFSELWNYNLDSSTFSSPAVADINNDNELEIVVATKDNGIHIINNQGQSITPQPIVLDNTTTYSSPAIGNLDTDPELEIVVASLNTVYALNHDGSTLWTYSPETNEVIESSPALVDINNDNNLEVIIGSGDNNMYVLDNSGIPYQVYQTHGPVKSSPAIDDINNDGNLEIAISSDDGNIYVIDANQKNLETMHWPTFHQNNKRTGLLACLPGCQDSQPFYCDGETTFQNCNVCGCPNPTDYSCNQQTGQCEYSQPPGGETEIQPIPTVVTCQVT
jgi:hypothetical protein